MKKILCFLLTAVMILGLCACSGESTSTEPPATGLQVGFGRADITPKYSVPLAGYGNTFDRMSEGFLNYLYATCVAITDEQNSTVLLITTDVIAIRNGIAEGIRQQITAATGVRADRIMFQGTHTHSGPDIYTTQDVMAQYHVDYANGLVEAAKQAMDDRSSATILTGEVFTENLNFVRHYTVSDGTIYGDNFGSLANGVITGHTSDADNQVQMIRFQRDAEGKKDILMVNYQAHAKMASTSETTEGLATRNMLSSDFIGATRDYVEKNADVHFAFYLGAAGNLNTFSKIPTENRTTDYQQFGTILGDYILGGLENMTPVEGTQVRSTQKIFEAKVDHSDNPLLPIAVKVKEAFEATGDYAGSLKAGGNDPRIASPYHAISIVNRANITAEVQPMEINAISVGGIGFITAPYEMFDTNGMYIKENSPFETTFIMTCANAHYDYFASDACFENGGTYEVHARRFVRGTAENVADLFVEMLNSLKG